MPKKNDQITSSADYRQRYGYPQPAYSKKDAEYKRRSTNPAEECEDCLFWLEVTGQKRGLCRLVQGMIDPKGTCMFWAGADAVPDEIARELMEEGRRRK